MAKDDIESQLNAVAEEALRDDVRRSIRELLESKFLYQSIKLDRTTLNAEAARVQAKLRNAGILDAAIGRYYLSSDTGAYIKKIAEMRFGAPWQLTPELRACRDRVGSSSDFEIIAPPVEVYCRRCRATKTHNSGALDIEISCPAYPAGSESGQVFTIGYQCQSCRIPPVVYQITRRADKFTLTGCSEYPEVAVPKQIPKDIAEYISEASIAFGSGRALAALFFLRTAIEQHLRKITQLAGRQSGDELVAAYRPYLAEDFPPKEWVLGKIYGELSEKLHSADPSETQFRQSMSETERYFRILELYPLRAVAPE